ncbi:16S rRNA (guanine(966)-N(2))-methyltransferase RsmD [Candidatus Dojkabacteria bacterium]|nr:16S rRNA (guanine(966)-N(2))-methyltransferase RsmD [Candidatus Dojkabacteria bacterium]
MVRIITGKAKGIQLKVPRKAKPISDRAKASLFSVIGPDIIDKNILDAFAGSGSLGIEALSRGAKSAVFVDDDRFATIDLQDNIINAKLSDKSTVLQDNALHFINNTDMEFDIVFADPPYDFYGETNKRLTALLQSIMGIIPNGGAIVIKHPKGLKNKQIDELIIADARNFGNNTVTIWVKK